MDLHTIRYNTIQYKTYNAPYVTKKLFVGIIINGSQLKLVAHLEMNTEVTA